MAFGEKHWWIYAVIVVVVPGIYFVNLLGQVSTTVVTEIEYQRPLLTAVGAAIVLAIVANIVLGIASPTKAAKRDVRDADISRLGEYVGGVVFAVGMVLPFALAMTEADHFWIANSMYLACVLSALAGTTVKLVAYRRGL
jgi:drug/metabolite transporter (DMT)-like permease